LLFTDNETNTLALYSAPNKSSYVKDAFHSHVCKSQRAATSPARAGTKAAARWTIDLAPGEAKVVRVRMSLGALESTRAAAVAGEVIGAFVDFGDVFAKRRRECDDFYEAITPDSIAPEVRTVHRQALASLLWSKQYYSFDLERWLAGDPAN